MAKAVFTGTIRKTENGSVIFVPEKFETIPYCKDFVHDLRYVIRHIMIVNNFALSLEGLNLNLNLEDITYSIWDYVCLLLCTSFNKYFSEKPPEKTDSVLVKEIEDRKRIPSPQ